MDLKRFHIGQLIEKTVTESGMETSRICNFLKCNIEDVEKMYQSENLSTNILLRWSKLLRYDFFRLYSQHLILYAPALIQEKKEIDKKYSLPKFRKSLYTKEIIDFILEQIVSEKMTKDQVIMKYRIPKTTLSKWLAKYKV
ncbi:transposase [Chryseobacterium pennipullorum]|uniref:Transposase n=1 Tax=Chryseobacterium pennipullorum TaxID=2258963 RepID=A0A3D9AS61_9FLAO|nr:transposase [Chryseobacterium pennipullorum]REC44239.1 transposase [Chryseobacterium pennipullorum]